MAIIMPKLFTSSNWSWCLSRCNCLLALNDFKYNKITLLQLKKKNHQNGIWSLVLFDSLIRRTFLVHALKTVTHTIFGMVIWYDCWWHHIECTNNNGNLQYETPFYWFFFFLIYRDISLYQLILYSKFLLSSPYIIEMFSFAHYLSYA